MTKIYSSHTLEQAIANNFLIVSTESSLHDVAELINTKINVKASESNVLCVLVVAESQLVGILTQFDLIRLMVGDSDIKEIKVYSVMTRPVVTLRLEEFQDVITPLNLLRKHHLSYLPILDEHNYPIGLITLEGLLQIADFTVRSPQHDQTSKIEYESLLTAIANRIQSSLDLPTILDTTVQEIRQFLQTDRVIAYRFEPDWSGIVVAESVLPKWNSLLGRTISDPHFQKNMVEPYKNGRIQVTNNVYLGGLTRCHMNLLVGIQVKAIIVVPILNGDKLWGLLAAQECDQPRYWEQPAIDLLQQLATHIGIAIQQSTTMAQLQQLNQELEVRIAERTIKLANSENHLNLIVSNVSDGILILDQDGIIIFANPTAGKIFGVPTEQLIGLIMGVPNELSNQFEISLLLENNRIAESEVQVVLIEWDNQTAYLISLHDITKRQKTEAQLLKIEADLSEAQRVAHVGSWELDVATQTTSWSDELYRTFGLDPNDPSPTWDQLRQFFNSGEWDNLNILVSRAVEFGEPYEVDLQIIRSDSSTGYVFAKGTPRRNTEGEIYKLFGITMDISDRKANEFMSRMYERVVSAATDAIVLYDRNYVYQVVNQVYLDWHNKPQQDIIGHSVGEVLGENTYQSNIQPRLERALAGEVQQYEDWFNYDDDCRRFVRVTYSPHSETDGSITGVLASLHDLTELKQTEEYLRKSEESLRRYFDQPLLGMAISNPDKSWQDVNSCFCKMLGYSHSEMLQKNWEEMTHPDDLALNTRYFNRALAGEIEGYVMDKRFICKNGDIIYTSISAQCLRNLDKSVNSFVVMVQDISDRKQAEAQLLRTNEQLARATRMKDEFLANMSHELRTPLNAILGMTEALQEQILGSINEKQLKALQTVERSGDHLLSLINDILDVVKIESGQIELDCALVNVTALCQSSLTFIKQQAQKKSIQLEIKLPRNLPDQLLDERRIRQVLINLLNNAVKFTLEGGRITLEVTKQESQKSLHTNDWIRFAITDTGIGIAPENIEKLFQPFIQIDSALNRQYSGTGLGLALVKQIVELHGGKVGLTSELGVGSCFTIDLLYTPESSEMLMGKQLAIPSEFESPLTHQPTKIPLILIVENNEINIITISGYLQAKGYRLIAAKNGQEAIALAKAHRPDLILMDIQMPVMDGLEAIQQIRLDPDLVNIPIIAMTALAMTGDRDRCIQAGADEYVTKPVKLKQLTNTIQQLLVKNEEHE